MADTDDDDRHESRLRARRSGPDRMNCTASAALLVIAEDLQLDGEVDLANLDGAWHGEHNRSEVQDAGDAGTHQAIGCVLRRAGRGGDDTDADALRLHDLRQFVDMTNAYSAEHRADLRFVDV